MVVLDFSLRSGSASYEPASHLAIRSEGSQQMHRSIIAVTIFLTAPAMAQSPGLVPEQIGQLFCLSRLAGDTGPIEGLLTPDLKADIAEAEARNAEIATQHPDEKPPLGDGIPWQAWPDYAPQCESRAAILMMDEARIAISYAFPDAPHADYTDYLLLRLIDEPLSGQRVWRIDNIAYDTEGDLRTALASAFMP